MGLKNSKDEEGETAQLKQTQQLSTGETISLHEAVINLDAKAVYHCLKNGASVNAGDEVGGYTPLHLAATNNSREIALKLLNQGADINAVTKGGRTVLQVALVSNASAVVSLLLRRGVDVNALDMMGRSALHFAAAYKNEEVAELIRHGSASVNKVGKWGFTPLHLAAFDNNKDAAKELLRQGACINAVKNDRRSALHVAARHGSTETALELMRCGADVNLIDKNGCTALHLAARSSNSEIVTGLLKRGAAVDAVNSSGRTALHVASQIDRTQVVAELLRQGANINAKDAIGITPSHVAATFHCRDTASMLVYSGANIALMDNTGETALHLAVIKNNRVTANAMLQADPNLVKLENRDGQTALHVAASAGSEENVELLLKKNVKVNAVDSRGNTALHYALANSRYNVTRILLEQSEILLYPKNKDGNSFLHLWASLSPQNKDYDFITNCGKSLIQGGAKVNARNDRDQTALHLAARWEAVTLLIDNGAWPNVKEMNNGETPLLTRVKSLQKSSYFIYNQQDKEEVQIQHWQKLLQKGFDPWMVDDSNETVLSILLKNENLCLANALVNVVAKNSKDVNKKHANGLTILHVLCSLGNDELQELIDSVLKLRASVNEVGPARETPLHLVCRRIIEIDDHQDSLAQTMFYWTASRLLAYGADPYLQDNSGESCLDIVQKIPQMLCLLKKPIDPGIIPPLLKWSDPRSENHRSKVAQVVRGHNSKKIHCYHYHKEPIGSGAFGHVYPGIDERNGREVAVKRSEKQRLLRPEARREISNLVKLRDCDEVVRYISHYEDDHFVYLILDLMEGMLEDYLDKFPRDLAEDLVLCKDIVKGLKFLHQNNILHRDIKPGNILYKVSPRLCLKLADFGLSGRATSAADGTTETRSVMHDAAGTRCWMAPELLQGTPEMERSEASDVFACGLVMYFILTGKKHPFAPPFTEGRSNIDVKNETERNIMSHKLTLDDALSCESSHVITAMLQNEQTHRPDAAQILSHPLFWSKTKMSRFIESVGNQPEIQKPRHIVISLSPVEWQLEKTLGNEFDTSPWDSSIYEDYIEMTCGVRGRRYDTCSAVELLRFMRNAYAHVSDAARSSRFKKRLLEEFVHFSVFPSMLMDVYNAVTAHGWDEEREEIRRVLEIE